MTDRDRRQRFFREMADVPLNPEDPRYYPLYEDQSDVVLRLKETILFSEGRARSCCPATAAPARAPS